jgi:hypothetical protein
MSTAPKLRQSDLPTVLELLSEMGFTATKVSMICGPATKVEGEGVEEDSYIKIGDGQIMATKKLPGFTTSITYSGLTWRYYLHV